LPRRKAGYCSSARILEGGEQGGGEEGGEKRGREKKKGKKGKEGKRERKGKRRMKNHRSIVHIHNKSNHKQTKNHDSAKPLFKIGKRGPIINEHGGKLRKCNKKRLT